MRCKVYVSDVGFGPLVRESAIVERLREVRQDLDVTVQTERHAKHVSRLMNGVHVMERFNNVSWAMEADGSPSISKIKVFFSDYVQRTEDYIADELAEFDYDFVISDFVYEAFHAAAKRNRPAFGVAHFTWDWFFSKMFPPPLSDQVLGRMFECAEAADVIYFPPFTPGEILDHYASKAKEVPLIVRTLRHVDKVVQDGKFQVLIMDSGASVLAGQIQKALIHLGDLTDFHFYMSSRFETDAENVTFIDPGEIFSDYMPHMDLVIARAGFNTISECLAYRTPILLLGEAANPEMAENMLGLKKMQLGSFVSLYTFVNDLASYLPRFVENEFKSILKAMEEHAIPSNGAEVVVDDILNRVEGT